MTDAPPYDCALHLRVIDTDVMVEFAGSGAKYLRDTARHAWARCLSEPSKDPVRRLVLAGTAEDSSGAEVEPDLVGTDVDELMDRLSPVITIAALEAQGGELLMLHAAAVADPSTGRALALVGPSGAGKTTATRVLARRWGYVTDETVGIRRDGSLAPYPKPLSIKTDRSPHKEQRSPDELELAATPERPRLHRVVLLARDDSAQPWLEEIATVEALALLAPETSYLSQLPRPLHLLASALGEHGLHRLHYREADQLPELVEQLLGED